MIVLIMAGGLGKRMNSTTPKVLHRVVTYPMIIHVIKTALFLNPEKIIIIVGQYKDIIDDVIESYLSGEEYSKIEYANQKEALGTGNAIWSALGNLTNYIEHKVLILSGDVPLISCETLENLMDESQDKMLVTKLENPKSCGRIIFNDENTKIFQIIEEKECSEEQKANKYVNCGIYQISASNLFKFIPLIKNENNTGEYYLTDIVELMKTHDTPIGFHELSYDKQYEIRNVNTAQDLEKLNNDVKYLLKNNSY
jgi:UDP-N-acetylglucosamine diphosphorylase/glucosamine-1-phosphate N-acetyltransferase